MGQVGKLNALISEIAASSQEQATGLSEVNTAVNQMDQVTQQNAAMVEQATAASHNLAQKAEMLGSLLGQFRIGSAAPHDGLPSHITPRPALGAKPLLRAVPGTGRAKAAPPASPERVASVRAKPAVALAQKEEEEEGWSEF
jgi:methyl-accepting chemotaxis protein